MAKELVEVGVGGKVYRYNGKEFDQATNLYDYGARYYDPAIARWGQIDPLADQYAPYSSYNYVLGNPIKLVDPDGMAVESPEWKPSYNEATGNVSYISEEGDSYQTFVDQYGEEEAQKVFNSNCDDCFDKSETFNSGDIVLNAEKPLKLVLGFQSESGSKRNFERTIDQSVQGIDNGLVTNDAQQVHDQIQLAVDIAESPSGSGAFNMGDYFTTDSGGSVPSFSAKGSISVNGHAYSNSAIEYSTSIAPNRAISSSPREGQLNTGFKHEYRVGYNVPLLVTYRIQ